MKSKDAYFEKEKVCKNCNSTQIDNYCSNCGQKIYTKRFTLKIFFFVFLDAFNIERGFIYTLKMLTFKPGVIINEYIKGKTKSYFNPLKYVILIAGIYAILVVSTNIFDTSIESSNKILSKNSEVINQAQNSEETIEFQKKFIEFFKQYINIIPILIIPFLSLVTMWFYRSKKLFYGEFLIVNCYLLAQSYVITFILSIPLVIIIPTLTNYVPLGLLMITIVYYSYALYKVFLGSPIVATIKAILIYVIGTLFFYIFFMFLFIIFMIIITLFGLSLTDVF
ncbi:MAG: DUF3667 domain-containing protein [Bacteroidales bacterium]|nr:DUF3667 domain-containing protein [Bacteroidales bacterium]